jgi:hypothetical protein
MSWSGESRDVWEAAVQALHSEQSQVYKSVSGVLVLRLSTPKNS